ncbi:MAG: hypothetical protein HYY95_15620 [Candidatus Rokubacteria bacterium]|nr:hypothetical protein [Candidatus Rokubacteria bacterium]
MSKRAGRTREPRGRKILSERGLDLGSFKEPFVILCRDALICIAREAQRKVFEAFSRVLRSRGYLVLGKTETISPEVKRRFTLSPPALEQRVGQGVAGGDGGGEPGPARHGRRHGPLLVRDRARGDRQHGQEHEELPYGDVQGAVVSQHDAGRLVLPPSGAEREVLVETHRHAGACRAEQRGRQRCRPRAPRRAPEAVEPHGRVPDLDDHACPGQRHPHRRAEEHHVVPGKVDEPPRGDPVDQPPVDEELEGAGDDPEREQPRQRLSAPAAQHIPGREVARGADEQAGVSPELARRGGRIRKEDGGDEGEGQAGNRSEQPQTVRGPAELAEARGETRALERRGFRRPGARHRSRRAGGAAPRSRRARPGPRPARW